MNPRKHADSHKKAYQGNESGKFVSLKMKNLEAEYGVSFGVNRNLNVSTYLANNGVPSLGKVLDKVERYLSNR